jgi:hypothetical protein
MKALLYFFGLVLITSTLQAQVDDISLGSEEFDTGPNFSLSPNPASDLLTLRLDEFNVDISVISVIDLSGRTVMQFSPEHRDVQQLDISSLNAGHYILSLTTSEQLNSHKAFVKY